MKNYEAKVTDTQFNNQHVTKQKLKCDKPSLKKRPLVKHFRDHFKISNDATFLRNLRLQLGLNRTEASTVLGMSVSSIKRYETGVTQLNPIKIDQFLRCYCVSPQQYMSFKAGKETSFSKVEITPSVKVIENNPRRRSYKKIITNEITTLIHIRKVNGFSQYELARLCDWNRCSIGHIENGRIELTKEKLRTILKALSCTMKKFNQYIEGKEDRKSIEATCIQKVMELETKKLKSLEAILNNF